MPTGGEVDLGPLEPAELALAGAAVERERVERNGLGPGRLRGRQEGLRLARLPAVQQDILVAFLGVGLADDELAWRRVPGSSRAHDFMRHG